MKMNRFLIKFITEYVQAYYIQKISHCTVYEKQIRIHTFNAYARALAQIFIHNLYNAVGT